jgi:hypothetical protein
LNCRHCIRGLKGHESIAQALAWVFISKEIRPEGRQKIVLGDAAGFQQKQISRNEPT